ncbi:DoxX family protein [Corynebacterium lizhenjunii]|uniref:DoxX family protein n=1 Tax=Corynebacterium lizhenjunii TaxID=2709394 RepID=UPI0013EAC035|nr:DoxX family protein [Corynebacterium lizhenjunii]
MIIESVPAWPSIVLALILVGDALLSLRPAPFIAECLSGVKLPRDWWWALILIKTLAAAGLLVGLWVPGVGIAAMVGVIAYFLAAAAAHVRAGFLGSAFWVNCLSMLALSVAALALTLAL